MQSNSAEYLDFMLDLAMRSGQIALKHINNSASGLKKDRSIITKADKEVSALCTKSIKKYLKDPSHLLIEEEDPRVGSYLNEATFKKSKYIWSIDPIDGTRPYANRMPFYGVSIGLLKDCKPWLGVVYFPSLKELFYCDGKGAYYVQEAFTPKAKKVKIKPIKEKLSPKSIFFCNDTYFNKFAWKQKDFYIMINACAVVNLCWPSIGRGVGCFLKSHLWDLAGSWPIMRHAGLDFRSVKTGKLVNQINLNMFNHSPKPWELKEFYLISSKENFFKIKSKIIELPTTK